MRIARDLLGRCRSLTRAITELDRELQARTQTLAPRLLQLPGCGPLSAAKLLCEIGPIGRFRSDAQLARHAGVAPLDASSGKHQRHRLDRGGNRQLNCALHRIAITQGRVHPPARAYLERKQAEGKSRREAIRCLKRQLARTVYATLRTESAIDIGATLAQRAVLDSGGSFGHRGSGFGPVAVTSFCSDPVVDVDEALEAPFRVFDDVKERAPIELHVGEVLEQHVTGSTAELWNC